MSTIKEITAAVVGEKKSGAEKVRVLIYTDGTCRKILKVVEFYCVEKEGLCNSILKSGKLSAHIIAALGDTSGKFVKVHNLQF